MEIQAVEIECPVCDHKISGEAERCPYCGVDLSTAGMEELETVARDISEGKPVEPTEPSSFERRERVEAAEVAATTGIVGDVTGTSGGNPSEGKAASDEGREAKKEGGLRRLFGKKKR